LLPAGDVFGPTVKQSIAPGFYAQLALSLQQKAEKAGCPKLSWGFTISQVWKASATVGECAAFQKRNQPLGKATKTQ
jgi:hypothetical protein